jgi:outer membrane protein assembly factor BamB
MKSAVNESIGTGHIQSPVRHLASSHSGSRIAAAEFEKYVSIWDVMIQRPVRNLITCLDFGGCRLAISEDGRLCITASFKENMISCFDTDSGREIWRRSDLMSPQHVSLPNKEQVIVITDANSAYTLSAFNGETVEVRNEVLRVVESEWGPFTLVSRPGELELRTRERLLRVIPRQTFGELAVEFGPEVFCVSESAGQLHCFDLESGIEKWAYADQSRHVTELCYSHSKNTFFAVDFAYKSEGMRRLLRFDPLSGKMNIVMNLNAAWAIAFCFDSTKLITADGMVIDTSSGSVAARLWGSNRTRQ